MAATPLDAVVVQGTDTIEEVALLLELAIRSEKPVVVTGAMRLPSGASSDGKANLTAAVPTAASPAAAGLRVLAVLNDEIHAAQFVSKNARNRLGCIPLADRWADWMSGRNICKEIATRSAGRRRVPVDVHHPNISVALLSVATGDCGGPIDLASSAGYHGLVFEGFGAGHSSVCMPAFQARNACSNTCALTSDAIVNDCQLR